MLESREKCNSLLNNMCMLAQKSKADKNSKKSQDLTKENENVNKNEFLRIKENFESPKSELIIVKDALDEQKKLVLSLQEALESKNEELEMTNNAFRNLKDSICI